MDSFLHFCLIFAWFWFQSWAELNIIQLPPVLEGSNITLTCSGITESTQRSVFFQVVRQDGVKIDAAICYHRNKKCKTYSNFKYDVENVSADYNSVLKLTLKYVRLSQRNTYYLCTGYDHKANISKIFMMWNLSDVYIVPESPKCKVYSEDDRSVNISCMIPKVYPNLMCELLNDSTNLVYAVMSSRKQLLYSSIYYSSSCSGVSEYRPGLRVFFTIKMLSSKGNVAVENSAVFLETNILRITSEPLIKLRLSNITECEETINITCTGLWFLDVPDIYFYIGDTIIQPASVENTSISVDNFTYIQYDLKYQISNLGRFEGKRMKCSTLYDRGNIDRKIEISDVSDIMLMHPPIAPPLFKYENGTQIEGDTLTINQGENIRVFCEVNGGKLHVSLAEIVCQSGLKTRIFSTGGLLMSAIVASSEKSEWVCTCCAEQESHCYNNLANLTIYGVPKDQTLLFETKIKNTVQYVSIAFFSCVGVIFLFVVHIFFRYCIRFRYHCILKSCCTIQKYKAGDSDVFDNFSTPRNRERKIQRKCLAMASNYVNVPDVPLSKPLPKSHFAVQVGIAKIFHTNEVLFSTATGQDPIFTPDHSYTPDHRYTPDHSCTQKQNNYRDREVSNDIILTPETFISLYPKN